VVKAQLTLGYRYGTGMGVEQNFTEAYHWLKMIDDEGDPSGAEQIAEFFEHGTGVPQSYSEAARWYRRAAEMGDGTSQWSLGEFYEKGTGVPKDLRQAKKWYSAAAAQGITNATLAVDRLANRGGARWEKVIEFKQGLATVDAKDVRHVQYPDVTQPISYDPLRYKMLSYSEVWAKATDENGDVSWQSLFLFDCKGRMAMLASSDFRANKRFDRSTTAQQMGAEVYMQPIGPDPIVEALERRVCRKK
jgi:TPR repeat protein